MEWLEGTFRGNFPEKIQRKILKNEWKITFNRVPKSFTRVVPPCMQVFSPGADQEGHFRNISEPEIVPNRFQNGPDWSPDGLWSPVRVWKCFRRRFRQQNAAHFAAKIDPKPSWKRAKDTSYVLPKPTFNFMWFFERFVMNFCLILMPKWIQVLIKLKSNL